MFVPTTRDLAFAIAAGLAFGMIACGGGKDAKTQSSSARTAAIAAGTTATPEPVELASNEGQIIVDDHAIIRQGAVGPLRVGEWRRPVMSFVYVVSARAGRDSEDIIVVRGIGKDTVTLAFANDTLRRILVTRPGARTADGIGVGTPFATVAGRPDATATSRGKAKVASLTSMCGVKFATDSAALSPDSIVKKTTHGPATVRAIAIGSCTH